MVSLITPNEASQSKTPQIERKVYGHFSQRILNESQSGQELSFAVRIGQRVHKPRYSGMYLDPNSFSWVSYLEAETQQLQKPIELATRRVMNENHREMTGAEKPDQATPRLKPLFRKSPTKFTENERKRQSEPKSLIGALLN